MPVHAVQAVRAVRAVPVVSCQLCQLCEQRPRPYRGGAVHCLLCCGWYHVFVDETCDAPVP